MSGLDHPDARTARGTAPPLKDALLAKRLGSTAAVYLAAVSGASRSSVEIIRSHNTQDCKIRSAK